ncbi:kyphoscoliosis peptidase-like [Saccostrea echinata]|uniref:kyphoscoliosis peptidase-like n=1 Tax=Saccostrea echinata TaxID=191078 RepID=UPI002A803B1A|nr:kyphoscoliosis peptidase-like [Saccostrea echinata]
MGCCTSIRVTAKDDQRTPLITENDNRQKPSEDNGCIPAENSQKPTEGNLDNSVENSQKSTEDDLTTPAEKRQKPSEDDLITPEENRQKPTEDDLITPAEYRQKPTEDDIITPAEKRLKPSEEDLITPEENKQKPTEDDLITPAENREKTKEENPSTPAENRQKLTEDDLITPAENGQKPTDDFKTPADNEQKPTDDFITSTENGQKLSEDILINSTKREQKTTEAKFVSPAKNIRDPSEENSTEDNFIISAENGQKPTEDNLITLTENGQNLKEDHLVTLEENGQKSTEDKVVILEENGQKTTEDNRKTDRTEKHKKDNYELVDAHAINAPKHINTSVNSLTEYLLKGAKSEKEKVRAFYVWIANNIKYDTDAYFGGNYGETGADSVLKHGKSVCSGYANLFEAFCKTAGIQVQVIPGFSKGYGYSPEKPITPNRRTDHAWNAVFLENKWQFVECTWGAGHVSNAGEFQREFNNFYFLTNPRHFIVDHFPFEYNDEEFNMKWQLLKNPISLDEFNRNIKLSNTALEWDIHPKSHKHGVIEVKGSVEITIADVKGHVLDTTFKFYEYPSGKRVEEYGFLRKVSAHEIKITLNPPKTVTYRVELFGTIDPTQEKLDELMTYVIKYTQASNVSPYPRLTKQWGLRQRAYENGFLRSDQFKVPALLQSSNGQSELTLRTTRNILSMVQLSHANYNLRKNFTLITGGKNFLKINLKFPSTGYYRLELMCQKEKDTDNLYHEMGNFLVECQRPADPCIPFPVSHPQAQEYLCILIEPLSGQLPANQQVSFKFKSSSVKKAIAGGENMNKNSDEWSAVLTTPGSGGSVDIMGTQIDENRFWGLFTFEVL